MCATRADKLARFHRTECWWTIKKRPFSASPEKAGTRTFRPEDLRTRSHKGFLAVQLEQNAGQMLVQRHAVQNARGRCRIYECCAQRRKTRIKYNNAPTVVKPSSKVSPTSGPLSPAKLKCCQPCARLERGTAAINASCSMKYNTKPIATAPRIAIGILRCGFFTSPASIRPFWKPVNANATPPTESAEKICCQSV